jgi:streptogramin lyase
VVASSKGNPYIAGGGAINAFDVAANQPKTWPIPTKNPMGRRGRMDAQDRFWFAEYYGDKIGMFDTRTEMFQEWPLRKYFTPYTASAPDRNGDVWAPSNMSDRLARLNPRTGEVTEYLMPTELDTKKIALDPSTNRVVLLMANMRTARILRVELLD